MRSRRLSEEEEEDGLTEEEGVPEVGPVTQQEIHYARHSPIKKTRDNMHDMVLYVLTAVNK